MILYRAADSTDAWTGACFTPDQWAAESYRVGPFGDATGREVYTLATEAHTADARVLEVEDLEGLADALESHLDELAADLAGMGVDGAQMIRRIRGERQVWNALESVNGVEEAIRWAGYSWLTYPDNTPAEKVTTTWRYYGATDLELEAL